MELKLAEVSQKVGGLELYSNGSQEIELPRKILIPSLIVFVRGLCQPDFSYKIVEKDNKHIVLFNENCVMESGDFIAIRYYIE